MTRVDQFAPSPEVLVSVERGGNGSLRGQIEHELRHAVRSGRLHAGTPLPSTRVLARQLGVARGVVVEAYAQLAAEGYLRTRQGAPTRVAPVAARPRPEPRRPEAPPPPRYDLRASVPDLSAFPRKAWLAAERRALADLPHAALDYPEMNGSAPPRGALASYLRRARGLVADPARIVVTPSTRPSVGLPAGLRFQRGGARAAL